MPTSKRALPEPSEYEKNRDNFTYEQLAPYEGNWVAFSMDGSRIVAAAPDLLELDRKINAIGEDPEQVGLEFIDQRAIHLGAMEFQQ